MGEKETVASTEIDEERKYELRVCKMNDKHDYAICTYQKWKFPLFSSIKSKSNDIEIGQIPKCVLHDVTSETCNSIQSSSSMKSMKLHTECFVSRNQLYL